MRNEPSKARSETSPVSPSLLVPATPQSRRAQNSLTNKMFAKSFKRASKPTYSDESLLEDAKHSNIDGYTIVTVRDQSCSTTQLETLCPGNNGDCIEEEVQSIAKEEEPSKPSPKPSLVERGSSAFIVPRKDQSTSIEQNCNFNEIQSINQSVVSQQTEDEDLIVLKASCKKDRKQVTKAKPPTDMSTTSDFCQSEYNTDDNYYQTENNVEGLDDLVEEKEKLQNLMHLIPLTTTDYPSAFSKSSSSSTATSVPPKSKCSRAKLPSTVTVAPKTHNVGFKQIDPRKLERCYKCKKCVLNSGTGNANNGLDKSSSYYKSSMCSCAKPRIKKSVQSDKLQLRPPHPKYEIVSPSPATSVSQYNSRRSKCERRTQRIQSLNTNSSSRQCLIQPSIYDTNGNTILLKRQSVEMSTSQCSATNCAHKNSQEICTNAVIPVSLVTPEPNCDCSTCTDESNTEKKHLVASCNFVFQFK